MSSHELEPFRHFEEQQRSHELVAEHRAALITDATELAREHPELETVGLILEANASEAKAMREAIELVSGRTSPGKASSALFRAS